MIDITRMQSSMDTPTTTVPKAATTSIFSSWPYLFVLALAGLCGYSFYRLSEEPVIQSGGYSAITYSPSTGDYGSASDCKTYADAERIALEKCKHPDARVVVWSKDHWCALAVADDRAFGFASGGNREEAELSALEHCKAHSASPCHVAVVVSSKGTVDLAPSASAGKGTYGAIAYSRSTGLFGASQGCVTYAAAESEALAGCQAADARIVTWAHGAWCALAVAEDRSYGYCWGHSKEKVELTALDHCRHYAKTPCRIAVVIDASGNSSTGSRVLKPGAGPAYPLSLRQFAPVGQSVTIDRTETDFSSMSADLPSKGETMQNSADVKHVVSVVTVLEDGAERPMKYQEFFKVAEKTSAGKTTPLSYQGQTITFEWAVDHYTLKTVSTAITAKDIKRLEVKANIPDQEAVIAPGRAVKVGEEWEIDIARYAKTLGPWAALDELSSTAIARLDSVTDRDGRRMGVIHLDVHPALTRIGPLQFAVPVSGTLTGTLETAIDGTSPACTFTQSNKITGKTELIGPGQNVPATIEFTYKSNQMRTEAK